MGSTNRGGLGRVDKKRGGLGGVDKQGRFGSGRQTGKVWVGLTNRRGLGRVDKQKRFGSG